MRNSPQPALPDDRASMSDALAPRSGRAVVAGAGWIGGATLLALYALVWLSGQPVLATLPGFWPFAPIGVFGATVASATGVGGGVVFVPVFSLLNEAGVAGFTPLSIVGTSFAIQCFGMSAGSLTWANRISRDAATSGRQVVQIVLAVMATALPALLLVQHTVRVDPGFALVLFKGFSVALGCAVLVQTLGRRGAKPGRTRLESTDWLALLPIGIAGGAATALFSVGVGELLALYLFLRRFPLAVCVAPAVICSALSVMAGIGYHLAGGTVVAEVLVFAAPAVLLGGWIAPRIAVALGMFRLKLFAGSWIVVSGLALLAFV